MTWDEGVESAGARIFADSFVARFDGKGFSRMTSRPEYSRPYDAAIAGGMSAAVERIIKVLSPDFIYSVSDEISAFFFARPEGQLPFGGKESKICSIGAAAAASAFSLALETEAEFDGRAFACPASSAVDYLLSRSKSGYKNSVSQLAIQHFSAKKLHQVNSAGKIAMLAEAGISYDQMPRNFKYGTIWCRETVSLWSEAAGEEIIRHKWRSTNLESPFCTGAISSLNSVIRRVGSQSAAAPNPDAADPEKRPVEASGQGG